MVYLLNMARVEIAASTHISRLFVQDLVNISFDFLSRTDIILDSRLSLTTDIEYKACLTSVEVGSISMCSLRYTSVEARILSQWYTKL